MTIAVSCIMPTANRRAFVPQAIAMFLAQRVEDAELIVLDNGADAVRDLVPIGPRLRYLHHLGLRPTARSRNRACEVARGRVIVHWDDDDWHAPDRVARQLAAMASSRADICGLARVPFLMDDGSAAWDYVWQSPVPWVYGATFAFRRDFWARYPFPDVPLGEDNAFVLADTGARIHAMIDDRWFVARLHATNTEEKQKAGPHWRPRDPAPLVARVRQMGGKMECKTRQQPSLLQRA